MYDIAVIKDGPLYPTRSGASYKIYNLILEYQRNGLKVLSIIIDRGWVKNSVLKQSGLDNILLVSPKHVYHTNKLTRILDKLKVPVIQTNIPELIIRKKYEWKKHKIIYDSHDFLAEQSFQKKLPKKIIASELFLDSMACEIADMIFCCSERDKKFYSDLGISKDKIKIALNGCRIQKTTRKYGREGVVFLGHLYYEPNLVALDIIFQMARRVPSVNFYCIGPFPRNVLNRKPKNVTFEGYVENIPERLSKASIGIAPLTQGSGSRVKILDYLANGLYVISSKIGASGLEDLNKGMIICDDFSQYDRIIKKLLKRDEPNRTGLELIKKYNFENIGRKSSQYIKHLINKGK